MNYTSRRAAVLCGFSVLAMFASHASAQEASEPTTSPLPAAVTNPAEADGDQIVVTGSRIARRDFSADSPIVTVGQQYLNQQAGATVGIKLQQLPQFTPGNNELVGSGAPIGRATVDLRGLGPNRTLVLADGRRLQPSTSALVVDLNTIPAALIDNIEVITGGASAVYGSDAISGVVNLRLRSDFEGLELGGQYNITERGDGQEYSIDGVVGTNFADNRGNLTFAIGYLDRGKAYFREREFYREAFAIGAPPWGTDLLPQGNFVPDPANLPSQAAVDAVFASYGVAPGSVANSAVLSFNPDSTLFSQFRGLNFRGDYNDELVLSTFSNAVAYNVGVAQLLTVPTERINVFSRAEFDITDSISIYAQGIYTDYKSVSPFAYGMQTQGTTAVVPADNPFIPADLQAILAARLDPTAPFAMRKLWQATGTSVSRYDNNVYQLLAGLRGSIVGDWTWDIYGSHGKTKIISGQQSGGASFSRIQALLTSRADASGNYVPPFIPSSNGSNSMVPNPAYATAVNDGGRSYTSGGSRPCPEGLDIFGTTSLSESCSAFLQIQTNSVTELKQDIVEGTVTGSLFNLPAGPLQIAVGADYRRNTYRAMPDPAGNDLVGSFGSLPVSGEISVYEAYGEAVVPVLRDLPLVQSLDLNLAYRYSDYDQSGGVSTYKASADWEVFDALRLRGGYQRAIRAPNVTELFNPQVAAAFLLGQEDPCNFDSVLRRGPNGAAIRELCVGQGVPASIVDSYKSTFAGSQTIQGGNPDLEAEKADTYTAGLVLAPSLASPLVERLSFSVDYYNIRLEEAISSLSPDIVFRRCFNVDGDNPSYSPTDPNCQAIQRNPASGAPDRTLAPYFNLGAIKTSGIDFQLDWGFPLSAFGLSDGAGRLDLNAVANYLIAFKVQPTSGSAFADYTGTLGYAAADNNGAHPRWKANTSLTYTLDPVSVALRWYYVGPMRDINGGPGLAPYSRFDLSGNVRVREDFRVSFGVSNLFDKQPLKTFGGLPGNTDSGTYDPLGRRYYISATMSFR